MAITLNGTTGVTTTGLTSNGIDDNATSTAMTLDTSGNLLVGKTSTSFSTEGVEVRPDALWVTRDGDTPVFLNRLTSDGSLLSFSKNGTTVGSIGTQGGQFKTNAVTQDYYITMNNGTDAIDNEMWVQGNIPPWIDGYYNLGKTTQRWKDLYLSGGVYLGGTGAANKLDDYEEGTWTPAFGAEGANPTVTYNTQTGRYTKVGNLVTVYGQLITISRSGGSGTLTVEGLPFTVSSSVAYASATIGFNYNWNTPPLNAGAQSGTIRLILYQDGRTNSVSVSEDILASGNTYFYFMCSYETNS